VRALNILIVDDDALIRWSLVRFLSQAGHKVAAAAGGLEALSIAEARHFDFVITDLSMPELDGWNLLEKLMGFSNPPRVIVMTAQEELDNYRKVTEKGGWAYIEKTRLLAGVTEALAGISSGYPAEQPSKSQ
jgi:DNA-binding NtrC family response regulator